MSDAIQPWWQRAIIHQVYPRSFQDTDGDGIGDLDLAALGIDTIWVSPIFPSPMADFGYDVADYGDIDLMFGTMADFERLIARGRPRSCGAPALALRADEGIVVAHAT